MVSKNINLRASRMALPSPSKHGRCHSKSRLRSPWPTRSSSSMFVSGTTASNPLLHPILFWSGCYPLAETVGRGFNEVERSHAALQGVL